MTKNKRGGNHFQAQQADAEFLYVATEGTGMPKVNLQVRCNSLNFPDVSVFCDFAHCAHALSG